MLGRRRSVVIGWLVLLVGALGASGAVGTRFANNFSLPGTESQRAADLLKRDFPAQAGDSDQIVLAVTPGSRDRRRRASARHADARAPWRSLPHVTGVISPYSATRGGAAISADGKIAFATVTFDERANVLPTVRDRKRDRAAKGAGSRAAAGGARRAGDRTGAEAVASAPPRPSACSRP